MASTGLIFISILTLNIWGLPGGVFGLAPHREARVRGICQELKKAASQEGGWDAVMLQEVWLRQDRKALSKCGYSYVVDLNNSPKVMDSGLLFLSRFPLKSASRLTFPRLPVDPSIVEDGEALVRKSGNLVKMIHPQAGEVWLANTHLVSYYAEGAQDKYYEIRRKQFISFAEWARKKVGNNPLIIGGDWNFGAHNPDLWKEKDLQLPGFIVSLESEKETTLSSENSFQEKDQGRVDHVFASPHFRSEGGFLSMVNRIEKKGEPINLSDHFGWTEMFSLNLRR